MKKIAILLCLALCTALTGCNITKQSTESSKGTSSSSESTSIDSTETSNNSILVTDAEGVGTDLFNGRVEIDGTVYKLGTPVKDWLKDGWELYGLVDQRIAPESSNHAIKIKKGDIRIGISVHNVSMDIIGIEDGVVSGISVEDGSTTSLSSFSIAGGIKLGMTEEDLEKVFEGYKVDKIEGTYGASYSISRNSTYSINVSTATDKTIKRIRVQVI